MIKTETRAGYRARLVTPYINTTGKCLELFYWIRVQSSVGAHLRLSIISISEELIENYLNWVTDVTPHFPKLRVRLPDGIHRIAIEGQRGIQAVFYALSLDDLTIMDCDRFGKMNMNREIKL